ncbi:cytochrome b-245 light chain-like [Watersipora subatra]|uniref:cytochrome b-245 light chain-like n=1 Tax=Watersipora subatra TaxID=2589382 RepID=UPI00355C219A
MGGHRNLEYAFWANEQTFGSAFLLFLGGVTGALPYVGFDGKATQFNYYWAGIYSAIIGLILMIVEYPRGKRRKGRTMERRYQSGLARFVGALGPLTRNYFSRFVIYFLLAIPSCILITTILGGVGVIIGSFIYLTSAIKGEEWLSPSADAAQAPSAAANARYIADAPNNPPPRRPVELTTGRDEES